ncbi:MAG: dihydropteroate synthase [Pseudomonadota bacterium]
MIAPEQQTIRDALLARAASETLIMGILNTTPDSFSDGGQFDAVETALAHAEQMQADGADMIDIGGESTRPGADPVPLQTERARTLPVIEALFAQHSAPLSIDTYKADMARDAVRAGAVLINDVTGLRGDGDMANAVAETGAAIVVTYNRGAIDPSISLVDDMRAFFDETFALTSTAGIPRDHIWLDPGVGFAKTLDQNFEAVRRIDMLLDYGRPILVGLSRKSFIGLTLDRPVDQRLAGTLAAHMRAVDKGARIVRAHDIAAHKDALAIMKRLDNTTE